MTCIRVENVGIESDNLEMVICADVLTRSPAYSSAVYASHRVSMKDWKAGWEREGVTYTTRQRRIAAMLLLNRLSLGEICGICTPRIRNKYGLYTAIDVCDLLTNGA